MSTLKQEFHESMVDIYRKAATEIYYEPRIFLQMVESRGGVGAAEFLLREQEPQEGFERLWLENRLDLTVEFHVLQPRFQELFDDEILLAARTRLCDAHYTVDDNGTLIYTGSDFERQRSTSRLASAENQSLPLNLSVHQSTKWGLLLQINALVIDGKDVPEELWSRGEIQYKTEQAWQRYSSSERARPLVILQKPACTCGVSASREAQRRLDTGDPVMCQNCRRIIMWIKS